MAGERALVAGGRATNGSRRLRRSLLVPAATVVCAALPACARPSSIESVEDYVVAGPVEFAATTDFLAQASQRSLGEPFRLEVTIEIRMEGDEEEPDIDAPLLSGEQDGAAYEWKMDLSEWLSQMPPGDAGPPPGTDLTVELAGEATTLYLRAPIYAAIADDRGRDAGPRAELAVMGDRWGRVDLAALSDLSPGQLRSATGVPAGSDPRAELDLVAAAADVKHLGIDVIDGDGVNGVGATVTFRQMIDAQGTDVDTYLEQMTANVAGPREEDRAAGAAFAQAIVDAEIPFEVWIDGEGYVRRVTMEIDMAEIVAGIAGPSSEGDVPGLAMVQTIDYFDYGDGGIEIDLPPPGAADAVELTDAIRRVTEAHQADG